MSSLLLSGTSGATSSQGNASATSTKTNEASDRFLKLLVTQLQNQDPMNPMDNAQITSQMAQIQTVTGIEKLNSSIGAMSSSFMQAQLMQGVNLVGHQVAVEGDTLNLSDGVGTGGFEITRAASSISVEIRNAGGALVDTVQLGSAKAGKHGFSWNVPEDNASSSYTFKVVAKSGSADLSTTHMVTDTVDAVSAKDGSLTLQLRNLGEVPYSKVKALS